MNELAAMGKRHGTDKGIAHHTFMGESYLDVYEKYFAPIRDKEINFLEIGVRRGNSVRLWKEFFPRARIFGLDNNPDCIKQAEDRIDVTIGSQGDPEVLKQLVDKSGGFDVVMDDGSHINKLTLASAKILLPSVRPGGLYIMEDLKTSYVDLNEALGHWEGELARNKSTGVDLTNRREDMDRFFMDTIRDLDMSTGKIRSVQFWSMTCVLVF